MRYSPSFMILLAACQDQKLSTFNSVPLAEILAPIDDAAATEGDLVVLRGSASDADDDVPDLLTTWYAGDTVLCGPSQPADDATTSCEWIADVSGGSIRLEVMDPGGAVGQDSVTVEVAPNAAPSVQIVSPVAGGRYYAGSLVELDGVAADAEDGPTQLTASWTSSVPTARVVRRLPRAACRPVRTT